ncbi:hypothetical protein A3H10_03635 [Candidatus Uhrbacteria bacterium RIFCSPLOWO2_12_FULL_46_10]|uniref:Bacterial type II secretion system protein E domain-containing protein n=1 Tax=Candidatus Uhrbacteria bacterium RIFCSPLOWO2_01_FULL_47_25 TaxID=1802402 RepID=A0A1F7UV67_9BACT|nr:MAG: type II secretion system protein E [Parcubacteria group bacterium GW2011_GWA2_46_9]OGL59079.1 MAG: hypothetical protein A2752_02590 [Candidatus Uhrbacteria bacterium RIFCSPHIGHO2_01_FULL_46_23]OGL68746.1 MAG: hypothetical protein A3D60_02195 [Candidatus Uhrbacteria bacterium RIFCSPHIGHO2_02_FULL_47_29]OGL74772.1 MAG: hypothetical protein A3E96_03480 [Candidatus Uhrbacteria bacterium RIFCSPHIGHO2_12_FULL_46_13]OGL82183.1 MAG: hypothetical protein A2936_01310 [Candidatus Uhrbacteria bacte
MTITPEKLRQLLVPPGYVSEADFTAALSEAKDKNRDVEEVLIDKDLIKDEQLGEVIAEASGWTFMNLSQERIDDDIVRLIPELVAKSQGVAAIDRTAEGIRLAMVHPDNIETKHLIEKRLGEPVIPYYVTRRDLEIALDRYRPSLSDAFAGLLERAQATALSREQYDQLVVETVDLLLNYAYQNRASDIHLEPYAKEALCRFRIDGILHDVLHLPRDLFELILIRIKILSRLPTDEHRAAQDGRFQFKADQEGVDVRVSIVPVSHGENVVMRILSANSRQFGLSDLGLSDSDLEKVKRAIKKPHGMALVTGPTGSGKTTTVYAVLKILNTRGVNIATIEDPVEYDIEGVSQIQVNLKTNLTFAKGLRSIVRQDPDIIMVGEIRDEETAGIAVNSAMTGHLVLSTLHANDAATTLPRLLDMGIEPFLLASTVNVAIAQRLVRKICSACRASYILTNEEKKLIAAEPSLNECIRKKTKNLSSLRLYRGPGCKVCGRTGYQGRIGIFEVLEMNENIRPLIIERASSDVIMAAARRQGMTTMLEDGVVKVLNGITTLTEVIRVTKE